MDSENRKRKYFDKLEKASSLELRKEITGVLDIQNDNLSCESHLCAESKLEVNLNDFLAKVQHYNKVNQSSYITKHGLRNINRGFHQRVIRSNIHNRNQLANANETSVVQTIENAISLIKPQQELVNYREDTTINFNSPLANSTTKYQQTQNVRTVQKQNDKPIVACQNEKYTIVEKAQVYYKQNSLSNLTSLSEFNSSKMIRSSDIRVLPSADQELNKELGIEKKAKLNSTECLYLEFVHSHCDEIKRTSINGYPNNDYTLSKIKQIQTILLNYRNKQTVNNTNLLNSSESFTNDNSIDFCINTSAAIYSDGDFVFKPHINFSNDQDISQFSQDSFVYSDINDSMDNQFKLELNNKWFSSPNSSKSEFSINNQYHREMAYYHQTSSINFNSFHSSSDDSDDSFKCQRNKQDSRSEDSYKYNKKKMFWK